MTTSPMQTQRGAALLLALLVTALATTAATQFLFRAQVEWRRLDNGRQQAQAAQVARAAELWAAQVLRDDARHSDVDHAGEAWALQLPPIDAEGYRLSGRISDLHGRFNLNNLVRDGQAVPAQVEIFRRLLDNLRLPRDLADRATDWLDADDLSHEGGSEGDDATKQHHPINRPLANLGELRPLMGLTPDALETLRPYVSVLPTATRINANTASAEVLAAAFDDLSLADAYVLVEKRTKAWFRNRGDLINALPAGHTLDDNRIAYTSRYFQVNVLVRRDRLAYGEQALLDRPDKALPTLLWHIPL